MSIIWNIVNIGLYFVYECYFAKHFKMSRDEGFVLWATGPSGVGKSTLLDAVKKELSKINRRVERLDGDICRQSLCSDLGFSKKDRESNIKRITFVAKMLSKNGVGVLASFISPYRAIRQYVRENTTNFIELHLVASKQELMNRDPKGLYAQAKAGKIKNLTGFDGIYEKPYNAEITINTEYSSLEESVKIVIDYLSQKGLI
ncbi:MAG: adenylyl-sulfate kinase [Candidatus Helarchaeota archaeon]